jgi:hypothetical protein
MHSPSALCRFHHHPQKCTERFSAASARGYATEDARHHARYVDQALLIMCTLTVASLHWAISAHTTYSSATPAGVPARLLELQLRVNWVWRRERSRGMRKAPDKHVCVDHIAAYYTPQWTQPQLEDFEFLVHASRAWKASARTSCLIVFTDTDSRNTAGTDVSSTRRVSTSKRATVSAQPNYLCVHRS